MKKILLLAMLLVIGVLTSIITVNQYNKYNKVDTKISKVVEEEVYDDCVDEYYELEKNEMLEASSNKERISPNCTIMERIFYKKCGHIISRYLQVPEEFVNLDRDEFQLKYKDWNIECFKNNEIVVYQERDEMCNEHYLVKDKDGTVMIYKKLEDGSIEEFEMTGITTEYLTENDKLQMQQGIEVYGKQDLNQLIEDYE